MHILFETSGRNELQISDLICVNLEKYTSSLVFPLSSIPISSALAHPCRNLRLRFLPIQLG